MKDKNLLLVIATGLVMLIAGFFGGMQFQKSKLQQIPEGLTAMGRGQIGLRNGGTGISQVRGTVLNKDEKSITLKLEENSGKIIIYTDSTLINKTEKGTKDDLKEGEEISVFGQTNSDGSVTADNIQIGINAMRNN